MGFVVNVLFLALSFITLFVASGFAANSAVRVKGLSAYDGNSKLQSAHKYLTAAAITGIITGTFLIIAMILSIVFAPEETEAGAITGASTKDYIVYGMLFLALLASGAVGVLSAIAATEIHGSGVSDNNLSYRNSIIAAVLGIVVTVLIIIALISRYFYKPPKNKKVVKLDKEIRDAKLELGEV